MNTSNEIVFPSGLVFFPIGHELNQSAGGTYKKKHNGIMFFDRTGEPIMFLKKSKGEGSFIVSASKREDNKIWYSYLSSKTEDLIGYNSIRFSARYEFAEKIWEKFFGKTIEFA